VIDSWHFLGRVLCRLVTASKAKAEPRFLPPMALKCLLDLFASHLIKIVLMDA